MSNNIFVTLSLEAEEAVKPSQAETEICIFAKMREPDRLAEAQSKEEHVQLEGRFQTGIAARVRKVSKDGDNKYIFTMKTPIKSEGESSVDANHEDSLDVDQGFFDRFTLAANRKLVKTRYTFNSTNVSLTLKEGSNDHSIVIPNVKYEIDVYKKADGEISEWCKIDIEVDSIIEYINNNHSEYKGLKILAKVSHLPFAPTGAILTNGASDEDRLKIDEIWKELAQPLNQDTTE